MHGWVYGLRDGLLKDLAVTMESADQVVSVFAAALKRYPRVAVPAGPAAEAARDAAEDDDFDLDPCSPTS